MRFRELLDKFASGFTVPNVSKKSISGRKIVGEFLGPSLNPYVNIL